MRKSRPWDFLNHGSGYDGDQCISVKAMGAGACGNPLKRIACRNAPPHPLMGAVAR